MVTRLRCLHPCGDRSGAARPGPRPHGKSPMFRHGCRAGGGMPQQSALPWVRTNAGRALVSGPPCSRWRIWRGLPWRYPLRSVARACGGCPCHAVSTLTAPASFTKIVRGLSEAVACADRHPVGHGAGDDGYLRRGTTLANDDKTPQPRPPFRVRRPERGFTRSIITSATASLGIGLPAPRPACALPGRCPCPPGAPARPVRLSGCAASGRRSE